MRVEREEVIRVIGTGIVIETVTGSESDTENVIGIMKGLGSWMVEVVGMEGGGWIGDTRKKEMKAGKSIVIVADHVPLLGMVTGGHLEVQFAHISGLCR